MNFYYQQTNPASFDNQRQKSTLDNPNPQASFYPINSINPNAAYNAQQFMTPKFPGAYTEDFQADNMIPMAHAAANSGIPANLQNYGNLGYPPLLYQNQPQKAFGFGQNVDPSNNFIFPSNPALGGLNQMASFENYPSSMVNEPKPSYEDYVYNNSNEEAALANQARATAEANTLQKAAPVQEEESKNEDEEEEEEKASDNQAAKPFKSGPGMKGWCEEDEVMLRKLAVQYKFDWKKVAKKFAHKKYTPYFLKMRYKGYDEGPVPKRVKFTHQEDLLIAKCFDEYGVEWEKMVQHFPNRTAVMIKNRYYSHIRKNKKLDTLLNEAKVQDGGLPTTQAEPVSGQELRNSRGDSRTEKDAPKITEIGKKKDAPEDGNKNEVESLKSQLKSLRILYLRTVKELQQYKNAKQN